MAIPDFQTRMLPLAELASDGNEWSMQDARDHLARKFAVSEEKQSTLLPSGRQPIFSNRVAWVAPRGGSPTEDGLWPLS
jgi:restriction system protein